MKQFFLTLVVALVTLTSCSSDDENVLEVGQYQLAGHWKAISIKATFSDGEVLTITDWTELQDELDGLEWVRMTPNGELLMLSSGENHSYIIKNNDLIITSSKLEMLLGIVSYKEDEIVLRYTSPSQSYTSLITYKKLGGKDITTKDIKGEWKASKIIATSHTDGSHTTITNESTIKTVLDGFDWVKLTEDTLTIMNTDISYSYSISNNDFVTSPPLQGRVMLDVIEENLLVIYYSSKSYSGFIVYSRV